MNLSTTNQTSKLTFFFLLFISYFTGFLIMAFLQTPEQMAWYKTLVQSPIAPPEITFGIVWGILYFLIPLSAFLVWDKISHTLFYGQYIIQLIWSFVFFQSHCLWTGFVILLCLCLVNGILFKQFYQHSKTSGLIFLPYVLWSVFATLLNFTVAYLN